jgi:hypothetical protein
MKQKIWAYAVLCALLLASLPAMNLGEDPPGWTDDKRLTSVNDYTSTNPKIATDSQNNTHVVWSDFRHGPPEIYYMKLDPSGNMVIGEKVITDLDAASSNLGDVEVDSNDNVHIIWADVRDTGPIANIEIYYEKLDSQGNTLVDETRLTNAPYYSVYPSIAVDSADNVHLAWCEEMEFGSIFQEEIFYMKLDNNGTALIDERQLTPNDGDESLFPDIQVDSNDFVHIVWLDDRNETGSTQNQDVFYTQLNTEGLTVIDDYRIFSRGEHFRPSIVIDSNDMIHLITGGLANRQDNNYNQLYYLKMDSYGDINVHEKLLTKDDGNATHSKIALDSNDNIHLVWEDERHYNNTEIYYMRLDDFGEILQDELRLTNNESRSIFPEIARDNTNKITVVWADGRDYMDGNLLEVYHKQTISGPANNPPTVGISSHSEGQSVSGDEIIRGWAADMDGTVDYIEVRIDLGSWNMASGTSSWNYPWNTSTASNGHHTIYARSFDGTDYSTEYIVNVTVDNVIPPEPPNTLPEVNLNSPEGGKVSGTVAVRGNASDSDGFIQEVQVRIDSGVWTNAFGTTSWTYSWDTASVSDGVHKISAKAQDDDGEYSKTDSVLVTVENKIEMPPFVNIISTIGQTVSETVIIVGNASDSDGDETIESVQIKIEDTWQNVQGTVDWSYTWDTTDFSDGEYNISVRAYDGAFYSEEKYMIVEVDNPHAPSLVVHSNYPDKVSGTITIGGTSSDSDGEIVRIEISIDQKDWQEISINSDWSYNLDTMQLSDGEHTISIRATDDEGEAAVEIFTIEVDNSKNEFQWIYLIMILLVVVLITIISLALRKKPAGKTESVKSTQTVDTRSPVMESIRCQRCKNVFYADLSSGFVQCPNCGLSGNV